MIPRRERVQMVHMVICCETSLKYTTPEGRLNKYLEDQIVFFKKKFTDNGYKYPCTKCVEKCEHE